MFPCGGFPADTVVARHALSAAAWRPELPEPVRVLRIHGTADTAIPCEGGRFRDEGAPSAEADSVYVVRAKEAAGAWLRERRRQDR